MPTKRLYVNSCSMRLGQTSYAFKKPRSCAQQTIWTRSESCSTYLWLSARGASHIYFVFRLPKSVQNPVELGLLGDGYSLTISGFLCRVESKVKELAGDANKMIDYADESMKDKISAPPSMGTKTVELLNT